MPLEPSLKEKLAENRFVFILFITIIITIIILGYTYAIFDIMADRQFLCNINPNILINYLRFILAITVPGYYTALYLYKKYSLGLEGFIVVDLIISTMIMMYSYILLTMLLSKVTYQHIWIMVFSISALSYFILKRGDKTSITVKIESYPLISMWYCTLFTLYIIIKRIPFLFWRGQDLWRTYSYIRDLLETSGSPLKYFHYIKSYLYAPNFGAYYMITSYTLSTGFSLESILRYGGLFQSILLSLVIYVTLKRHYGNTWALFGSFSIFFYPAISQRYVSILREDLSIIYLIFTFYYLNLRDYNKRKIEPTTILILILLITSTVIIHPLTPIFLLFLLIAESLKNAIKKQFHSIAEIYISILLSFIILGALFPLPLEHYYQLMKCYTSNITMVFINKSDIIPPIKRLEIYAILLITYLISHLLYHTFSTSKNKFTLDQLNFKSLTEYKYLLLTLFLFASCGLYITTNLERYGSQFSRTDIQNGYTLKNQINNESKIYSPDHIQDLLWYIDIPYDNLVTEINHRRNINRLLNQSSPQRFSDYLTKTYDIQYFYYCISSQNEHIYNLMENKIFRCYAKREIYGSVLVYAFKIPLNPRGGST